MSVACGSFTYPKVIFFSRSNIMIELVIIFIFSCYSDVPCVIGPRCSSCSVCSPPKRTRPLFPSQFLVPFGSEPLLYLAVFLSLSLKDAVPLFWRVSYPIDLSPRIISLSFTRPAKLTPKGHLVVREWDIRVIRNTHFSSLRRDKMSILQNACVSRIVYRGVQRRPTFTPYRG